MQMNNDGLFAYKNYMIDSNRLNGDNIAANFSRYTTTPESTYVTLDELIRSNNTESLYKQYVHFSENGLFLTAEEGAMILKSKT